MRCLPISAALVPCVFALLSAQSIPTPARTQPGTLPATETEPDLPIATPQSIATPGSQPLDFQGKLHYFIRATVSPQTLGRVALTTGFSHAAFGAGEWGGGADGFGEHLQSRLYEHFTRRTVQFAVGAARREDPRFYRSDREGFWNRTKFVLSRTVITQMDDGSTSLAVGRLTGYAAGNVVSAYRYPSDPSIWKHTISNTGVNIGGDISLRMIREFWPDIRRKLKR